MRLAVQGIVEFFTIDCKNDSNKIKDMYEKRFIKEIYGNDFLKKGKSNEEILKELKEQVSLTGKQTLSENNKTLHFQRRILAQFFCDLDICARSIFIGKKTCVKGFYLSRIGYSKNPYSHRKSNRRKPNTDEVYIMQRNYQLANILQRSKSIS